VISVDQAGVGPILGAINCQFKYPVTFPDTVSVGVRTVRLEDDRFVVEHCVVSHTARRVAAIGEGVIVAYDYRARKKARLPDEIKRKIQELEDLVAKR